MPKKRPIAKAKARRRCWRSGRAWRAIHDTLVQGLTGVVVQSGAAQSALQAEPEAGQEHLELAQRMARETLAEAGALGVEPACAPALEQGDLSDTLCGLAEHPPQADPPIRLEQAGTPCPPAVESALLRVCQEVPANVAKHARATEAVIRLAFTPDAVSLAVCDNGIGWDETALQHVGAPTVERLRPLGDARTCCRPGWEIGAGDERRRGGASVGATRVRGCEGKRQRKRSIVDGKFAIPIFKL